MQHKNNHRVCIVGAGLAGLATIASLFEEAKKNPSRAFKIDIFDKRNNDYRRRQKLVGLPLDQHTSVHWNIFIKKIFDPENKITLDDKGDLLFEKTPIAHDKLNARLKLLKRLMLQEKLPDHNINFSIRSLQLALEEHIKEMKVSNIDLSWHWETKHISFNLAEQQLLTGTDDENKQTFTFDTLVMSEGSQRELTSQINAILEKEKTAEKFNYKQIDDESYCCAIRLKVNPEITKLSAEEIKSAVDVDYKNRMRALIRLGWNPYKSFSDTEEDPWMPPIACDGNSWKGLSPDKFRAFAVGQISEKIYHMQNNSEKRAAILEWASILVSEHFKIPRKYFLIDTTGETEDKKLNAVTFVRKLIYVDNPVRQLATGGHIVVTGDCAISPDWLRGFSSIMALNEAIKVAECIAAENDASKNPFQPLIQLYDRYKELFINEYSLDLSNNPSVIWNLLKRMELIKNQIASIEAEHSEDVQRLLCMIDRILKKKDEHTLQRIVIVIEREYKKITMNNISVTDINADENSKKYHYARMLGLLLKDFYEKIPARFNHDRPLINLVSQLVAPPSYASLTSKLPPLVNTTYRSPSQQGPDVNSKVPNEGTTNKPK